MWSYSLCDLEFGWRVLLTALYVVLKQFRTSKLWFSLECVLVATMVHAVINTPSHCVSWTLYAPLFVVFCMKMSELVRWKCHFICEIVQDLLGTLYSMHIFTAVGI